MRWKLVVDGWLLVVQYMVVRLLQDMGNSVGSWSGSVSVLDLPENHSLSEQFRIFNIAGNGLGQICR